MKEVLFVCTGNTCRSAISQGLANDLFNKNKMDYNAISRGINVIIPSRASENAVSVMKKIYNIDITNHISKQLSKKDLENANLILCMTENHLEYLSSVYPEYSSKIFTMYGFISDNQKDVKDPFGKDYYVYKKSAEEIDSIIHKAFGFK